MTDKIFNFIIKTFKKNYNTFPEFRFGSKALKNYVMISSKDNYTTFFHISQMSIISFKIEEVFLNKKVVFINSCDFFSLKDITSMYEVGDDIMFISSDDSTTLIKTVTLDEETMNIFKTFPSVIHNDYTNHIIEKVNDSEYVFNKIPKYHKEQSTTAIDCEKARHYTVVTQNYVLYHAIVRQSLYLFLKY